MGADRGWGFDAVSTATLPWSLRALVGASETEQKVGRPMAHQRAHQSPSMAHGLWAKVVVVVVVVVLPVEDWRGAHTSSAYRPPRHPRLLSLGADLLERTLRLFYLSSQGPLPIVTLVSLSHLMIGRSVDLDC